MALAPLKVLYVLDKSGFGGVQTIAYSLMKHVMTDVDMSFLFLRNVNERFGLDDIQSDRVFYAKGRSKFNVMSFLTLVRLVRRQKIDTVHMNGNKAIIFGYFLKKLFPGLRMLAHDHGGVHDYSPWYAWLLKVFRRSYDSYVCVSEYRKSFYVTRCSVDTEKIKVIDNFVDLERIGPVVGLTERSRKDPATFVLGYVGGLSWLKGCDVLLRAIPLVEQRIKNLKVLVAGDGPARKELERLAVELAIGDKVVFLGFVADVTKIYAEFDLMVIPSRSEEGPICLYEAWALKLPVLASDAPVLNGRIKDRQTGVFFKSGDPKDLAEKIVEICRDQELREHIASVGGQQIENLTVARYWSQLQKLYE
jgi:glycosyltransferase involved in cell wall biosynthesis